MLWTKQNGHLVGVWGRAFQEGCSGDAFQRGDLKRMCWAEV